MQLDFVYSKKLYLSRAFIFDDYMLREHYLRNDNIHNTKTILIVEDDDNNLKLVNDLLLIGGYNVHTARNGKEGVDKTISNLPDLVLMDIQMPVMNGIEATRILKKDIRTQGIPIVAVTSYAMSGDKERIMGAGCDGYLTKPINVRSFLGEVQKYLK